MTKIRTLISPIPFLSYHKEMSILLFTVFYISIYGSRYKVNEVEIVDYISKTKLHK